MKNIPLLLALLCLPVSAQIGDASVLEKSVIKSAATWIDVRDYGAIPNDALDDTAAGQAAMNDAAASTATRTVYFPPGSYKGNWTIPVGVRVGGAGDNGCWGNPGGVPIFPGPITVVSPWNEALAVFRITQLDGQHIEDMHIKGIGRTTSTHGVLIRGASNNPVEFVGCLFQMRRCTVSDFQVGIEINNSASNLLEHVWSNRNRDQAYKFTNQSDTISMHKCGGSWNDGTIISTVAPKGLLVLCGEWGNGPGPVITTTGIGQISFISNNVESVTTNPIIITDGTSINADLNRSDCVTCPAFIRQMDTVPAIEIRGGYIGISPTGYIWEGPTAARAPLINGMHSGPFLMRWSPTNAFASTLRTQDTRRVHVRALKTGTQAVATNTDTAVAMDLEELDYANNYTSGVFTAPSAGVYSMKATFMVESANAAASRMVEMVDGAARSILWSSSNHGAYMSASGSVDRYLTAGQTMSIGYWQNSGGSINIFGSGAQNECTISITKISD